jgi:hypothetical protein
MSIVFIGYWQPVFLHNILALLAKDSDTPNKAMEIKAMKIKNLINNTPFCQSIDFAGCDI